MNFLKGLLLDHDGKPSFSRVGSAVVITACVFWLTYATIVFKHIPDNANGVLLGTAAILTSLYSANTIGNSINNTTTTTTTTQ